MIESQATLSNIAFHGGYEAIEVAVKLFDSCHDPDTEYWLLNIKALVSNPSGYVV